ncbi:hypothetical protein K8R04_02440 [Candidatus Uhrbacteria bacterium]|nr:hypothetical protein [Candidatus Uhrbacteria bacterium]
MEINIATQRILLLKDQVTPEIAKERAWQKKVTAFDAFSKVTSLLSKPKDEDFTLVYSEHRYEPFWHVVANARYEYIRSANYQVETSGKEVKTVTVHDVKYEVQNDHIHIPVQEHCFQEEHEDLIVDGITAKPSAELQKYLSMAPFEVTGLLKDEVEEGAIFVPPQARVSAIMRDALAKMIKGIHADTILAEEVEVARVDLYYRPVYAFKYAWASKQKEAILEVDGLTGEIRTGSRVFKEYMGKILDQNFLFDVGADAVGMFVPGGSIAVKVAKKYMDTRKEK